MPQEKVKKIHLIYGCIAAVLIVAVGIALILSCLDIYHSGPRPYNPESIGVRFDQIAVLVYVCIAVILGGIVLNLLLPLEKKRPKAIRDDMAVLNRLKEKAGVLDDVNARAARKEVTLRRTLRLVTALVFVGLMVYPAIYFMDATHFTIVNLNQDIAKAVTVALIPAVIGLLLCFGCSMLESKSIQREVRIYKNVIAANKVQTASPAATPEGKKTWLVPVRCVILAAAICFIIIGVFNGGAKDVLDKAVAICTECIGLG